ncbi:hypothetical protein [Pseudoxanthomonas sacheonensis]|uniref:hypothetical protein n=1 Tax=Pseudoxanthomonas sacheonensis TaxID=443615 RepID=UPI0013D1386C|nr:hypothetical protein [Pseudoxanthomonas sacheonensis]KAF1711686.1 hypothetical protein CSC73_02760 [Pseudoxanthomonas sacheonensis]
MRKAESGQHWVATWKTQSERFDLEDDTVASRVRDEEVIVWAAVEDHFNAQGFGAYRLEQTRIPARHPSTVADVLLNVAGTDLRGKVLTGFIAALPIYEDVEGAETLEQAYQALEWLKRERKLTFKRFPQEHDWPQQIILPSDDLPYGGLFVPKGKGDLLVKREYQGQLSLSHDLVDVLATKHQLFAQLGMHDAINKDWRRIDNALDYNKKRAR